MPVPSPIRKGAILLNGWATVPRRLGLTALRAGAIAASDKVKDQRQATTVDAAAPAAESSAGLLRVKPSLLSATHIRSGRCCPYKATAFAMLIEMPELGSLEGKQAASLAGLAPFREALSNNHAPDDPRFL